MTPEDWTTTTYKPSIVCSDGNDGVTLFTCGHEKRSLHCVEQNISVLLWYPRHGEVLHLLTLTTTRLKSFEVSLGIQVQGRSWRKTRCLWHNPTFASHRFYCLPLQGRHHPIGHKEDLQFCQQMVTLSKKWAPSRKPDENPQHWKTLLSHLDACGRQYFLTMAHYNNKLTLIHH